MTSTAALSADGGPDAGRDAAARSERDGPVWPSSWQARRFVAGVVWTARSSIRHPRLIRELWAAPGPLRNVITEHKHVLTAAVRRSLARPKRTPPLACCINEALDTRNAKIHGQTLAIAAATLNNANGKLTAGADATLRIAGALDNTGGLIAATGQANIQATQLDNRDGTLAGGEPDGRCLWRAGQSVGGGDPGRSEP
ncbi:hypothetical protein FQR65_LT20870 [Abscondita terminalis]|nr:hypothetical protein FQR65_LT20870 [Abscondita terminalis]